MKNYRAKGVVVGRDSDSVWVRVQSRGPGCDPDPSTSRSRAVLCSDRAGARVGDGVELHRPAIPEAAILAAAPLLFAILGVLLGPRLGWAAAGASALAGALGMVAGPAVLLAIRTRVPPERPLVKRVLARPHRLNDPAPPV
jgi:hypothetical protein